MELLRWANCISTVHSLTKYMQNKRTAMCTPSAVVLSILISSYTALRRNLNLNILLFPLLHPLHYIDDVYAILYNTEIAEASLLFTSPHLFCRYLTSPLS